jgi:hypothetical protein
MPDTLVGIDALIRSELEGFASNWFWTLLIFTFLVALGLTCEFPEIWHDTLDALRKICRFPAVKEKLPPWAKLSGTFGWALIIAGVIGEGVAEGFLYKADGLVLKFDEILLQDTTGKSNSAVVDAVALAEKFGGLHKFVEARERELNDQFGAFNRYADDENKRAEAVIAELNSDRQKLDKSRVDAVAAANEAKEALKAVTAARQPRDLTVDQQRTIAEKMSAWTKLPNSAGRQRASVFVTNESFEGAHLAEQIAAALGSEQAGWDIDRNHVTLGNEMALSGVGMFASRNVRGRAVATALAKALNDEGIAAFVIEQKWKGCEDLEQLKKRIDTDPWCSRISVMVGDHP